MERKQSRGIDVSRYQTEQGRIDFAAVRAGGAAFVMVRAGWCGYEGEMHFDARFESTVKDAAEAGVAAGLYVYSYAMSEQAARRAARETLEMAAGLELTYPVAFDIEDARLIGALGRGEMTKTVQGFCEAVRERGYYPMFYTYLSFAKEHLDMEALAEYDFWIADYTQQNTYDGAYTMWQYSGTGTCPGVVGKCDLDLSYLDYPKVIREAGLNGLSAPKPDAPVPDSGPETPKPERSCGFGCRLLRLARNLLRRLFPF